MPPTPPRGPSRSAQSKAPSAPSFPSPSPASRRGRPGRSNGNGQSTPADKAEHEILFQTYFKSVGPRTYAAQVKRATNGNHYLVLTEGKRDEGTGEVRKTRLFVFSEDFSAFFHMLQDTARFVKDHPVPDEVKKKRDAFWAKRERKGQEGKPAVPAPSTAPVSARPGTEPSGRRTVPTSPARPAQPRRTGIPPMNRAGARDLPR